MKFFHIATLATLLLVGCATTNSQEEIDYAAGLAYFSYTCANAGLLDQETSAKGMAHANSSIQRSETPRYRARAQQYVAAGARVTKEQCTDLRLRILTAVATKELKSAAPIQAAQPRYTNCSTYFGQTHCTTY